MKFRIDEWQIDLGQTPIENMFLNSYMLMAPGDAVKAYLYGYKIAFEKGEQLTAGQMARDLQITEEELDDIWTYWEQMGLIRRVDDRVLFLSLRQLYLGIEKKEPDYFAEPEELIHDAEEPETKMLIEQIEQLMTVKLRPNQVALLLQTLKEYPMDKEAGFMSFTYAFHTLKTRDFDYALGVWRKWYIAGVRTLADVEKHLEKEKNRAEKKQKGVKETGFTTAGQMQDDLSDDEVNVLVKKKMQKRGRIV